MKRPLSSKKLVIYTVILWAFAGTLIGRMSQEKIFSILTISFLSSSLFNYYYFKRTKTQKTPTIFLLSVKHFIFGLCGYFFYNLFYAFAVLQYGNVSEPTLLNYTWPFFTTLFTILIYNRQKIDASFFLSTTLGLAGVFLLASKGNLMNALDLSISYWGLTCGLLTGASYGLFSAFSSSISKEDLPRFLFTATTFSFLFMLIFSFSYYGLNVFKLSFSELLLALLHGLLLDSMGHAFWTRAQSLAAEKNENLTEVNSLAYFLPILSLVLISVFLGEEKIFQNYVLIATLFIMASALVPIYLAKFYSKIK